MAACSCRRGRRLPRLDTPSRWSTSTATDPTARTFTSRSTLFAEGSTPTNKLTTTAKSQYFAGGTWHNYYQWKASKYSFIRNGGRHNWDSWYTHEGTNQYNWRIVATLKAWNGSTVLAQKTLTSKACQRTS